MRAGQPAADVGGCENDATRSIVRADSAVAWQRIGKPVVRVRARGERGGGRREVAPARLLI